jgi:hypothetical protein
MPFSTLPWVKINPSIFMVSNLTDGINPYIGNTIGTNILHHSSTLGKLHMISLFTLFA